MEEEESYWMEKLKALPPSAGAADTAGNNGAGSMHTQERQMLLGWECIPSRRHSEELQW